MRIKNNLAKSILVFISLLLTVLSLTGCEGEEDLLKSLSPLSVNLRTLAKEYVVPGESDYFWAVCEPTSMGPDKPVFVWKITRDGTLVEEIVHDSDPGTGAQPSPDAELYSDEEDEKDKIRLSWPNYDSIDYVFNEIGTYVIETSLYEYDEYARDGNAAPAVSIDSRTFYCENIKLSVEADPTKEDREYRFRVYLEHPKIVPYGSPVKWQFIDTSTGNEDSGLTEEGTLENSLFNEGFLEVYHTFKKAGNYRVVFSILDSGQNPKTLASAEVSVGIESGFRIACPAGPYKTGRDYTFTAVTDSPGDLTEAPSYEWDFGDGNMLVLPFTNEATHSYDKPGKYVIYLEVFDSAEEAANVLGTAYLTVEVEESPSHLLELQKMKQFALDFAVQHDYVEGMSGLFLWDWDSYGQVTWDGIYCSMEWSQYNHSERMTGRVSEDGTVLEQLKIRHEFVDSKGETDWYEIEIQNMPFWEDSMPNRFTFDVSGEDVEKYVTYFNSRRTDGYHWDSKSRLFVRFLPE